jgi:YVTN family beta-propeller protein
VVVSPDGRTVYVADGRNNSVVFLDAVSGRILATVAVGRRPWGIAMTSDGRKLYSANGLSNDVSVVDTKLRRIVKTIRVGEGPWGITVR